MISWRSVGARGSRLTPLWESFLEEVMSKLNPEAISQVVGRAAVFQAEGTACADLPMAEEAGGEVGGTERGGRGSCCLLWPLPATASGSQRSLGFVLQSLERGSKDNSVLIFPV